MKAGKEHVVPLTGRCLEMLESLPIREDSPYAFAALRGGKLSDATVGKLIKTLHRNEVVNLATLDLWITGKTNALLYPTGFGRHLETGPLSALLIPERS